MKKIILCALIILGATAFPAHSAAASTTSDGVASYITDIESNGNFSHYVQNDLGVITAVFNRAPDSETTQKVTDSGFTLVIDESALSSGDAERLTNQLTNILEPLALSLSVGPNPEMSMVVVTTRPEDVENVSALISKSGLSPHVEVVESTTQIQSQVNQIGGGSFDGACTGAFMAYRYAQLGVITAKHCFDPVDVAIAYNGTLLQSVVFSTASNYDVAFIGLEGTSTGLVRMGGVPEKLYFGRNPIVGESVCHYGITTGKSCSKVIAVNQAFVHENGKTTAGLTIVQHNISEGGDSGGPWFTNSTTKGALGIHYGLGLYQGSWRSIFTRVTAVTTLNADIIYEGMQ